MVLDFAGVVISPGPGAQESAGVSIEVVENCEKANIPVLGICLGLQVIGIAFGAKVVGAPELIHGRTSIVEHKSENIFKDIFIDDKLHMNANGYTILGNKNLLFKLLV